MEANNEIKDFNVAEVLKNAPKGLRLYSPLFGEVDLSEIENGIIRVENEVYAVLFNHDGRYYDYPNAECLLFPSVNHRCWNNWQNILFPKSIGSVCVDTITGNKFILDHNGTFFSDGTGSQYPTLIDCEDSSNYLLNSRYATPEEAKEFFDELEKNGYKWDGKMVVKSTSQPKFKVGDWIVDNCNNLWQVVEVSNNFYRLKNINESESLPKIKWVNETFHLWSVKDVKDGDVLYSLDSKQPFIFKHRKPNEQAEAYCGLNIYGKFFVWGTKDCVITTDKYIPSTKEQRDLLFKKMQEAGYEWSSEHRKLIKRE